ncbi:F-box only protein 13-like isoform X1 [Curcuma longa]|uniref:F-box only protein 13-like isoform X1 n=2 Tax=Curcuma longa TaxID=136217 RepID=UPI003D9E3245
MEQKMVDIIAGKNRKRKANEAAHTTPFLLDELNEDLLERVLSWLPASSLFRLGSVCKRWRSVATSETFHIACSQIPSRQPWFLMVDHEFDDLVVYDTSERNWKSFTRRTCNPKGHNCKAIPVAASGGLVCYRTDSGGFFVCNLLTGSYRKLPPPVGQGSESQTLHAIAMYSSSTYPTFFKIVLVLGKPPNLVCRVFDSVSSTWEDEITLLEKADSSSESQIIGEEIFYFLSKAGDVVATNMQRSPSKQYSSVLITENGEQVVYFLSESGTVVACNLTQKTFFEYPRILPIYFEYSIDVVGCKGEMLVVVLSEFLETASLRVWKFSKEDKSWKQVAAMPPAMSHEFHGQKMDINCTSYQDVIFICASSSESSRYITFSVEDEEWVELPRCNVNRKPREFMSAISFEPRVEATV